MEIIWLCDISIIVYLHKVMDVTNAYSYIYTYIYIHLFLSMYGITLRIYNKYSFINAN